MDKKFWQSKKFWASVVTTIIGFIPTIQALVGDKDLSWMHQLLNGILGMIGPVSYTVSQAMVDSKVYAVKALQLSPVVPVVKDVVAAVDAEKKS